MPMDLVIKRPADQHLFFDRKCFFLIGWSLSIQRANLQLYGLTSEKYNGIHTHSLLVILLKGSNRDGVSIRKPTDYMWVFERIL